MTRQEDIKRLIINHSRRLQKLKEQHALEGNGVDPKVLIEMEDIKVKIEILQLELASLDEQRNISPEVNILVVDNNPDVRHTITGLLTDAGYTAQAVHNGREALDTIIQEQFDFAFVDIRLQDEGEDDESGLLLALAIKGIHPTTHVTAITGFAKTELAVRALRSYNLDWFIEKGVNMEVEILNIISRHSNN